MFWTKVSHALGSFANIQTRKHLIKSKLRIISETVSQRTEKRSPNALYARDFRDPTHWDWKRSMIRRKSTPEGVLSKMEGKTVLEAPYRSTY